jgi:hypothetical protein
VRPEEDDDGNPRAGAEGAGELRNEGADRDGAARNPPDQPPVSAPLWKLGRAGTLRWGAVWTPCCCQPRLQPSVLGAVGVERLGRDQLTEGTSPPVRPWVCPGEDQPGATADGCAGDDQPGARFQDPPDGLLGAGVPVRNEPDAATGIARAGEPPRTGPTGGATARPRGLPRCQRPPP